MLSTSCRNTLKPLAAADCEVVESNSEHNTSDRTMVFLVSIVVHGRALSVQSGWRPILLRTDRTQSRAGDISQQSAAAAASRICPATGTQYQAAVEILFPIHCVGPFMICADKFDFVPA